MKNKFERGQLVTTTFTSDMKHGIVVSDEIAPEPAKGNPWPMVRIYSLASGKIVQIPIKYLKPVVSKASTTASSQPRQSLDTLAHARTPGGR